MRRRIGLSVNVTTMKTVEMNPRFFASIAELLEASDEESPKKRLSMRMRADEEEELGAKQALLFYCTE